MQRLGSLLSARQAKNDDLEKHLAAFEEKAKINEMVHDHEERGVSTFHHNRYHMAHVFESFILPHITNRPIRAYVTPTTRISFGVQPSLRSSLDHSLFSSNFRSLAETRYSIRVCVTWISRLFIGSCRLAT